MRRTSMPMVAAALTLIATPLAAQEQMQEGDNLEVSEAVVATDIQDREPVGVDSTFTADVGTVYFYTVFEGDFGEMDVEHVWLRDGEEIARVPLTVEGPRWRTWSSKEILPDWTGTWTVKVVDSDGAERASVDFTLTAGM